MIAYNSIGMVATALPTWKSPYATNQWNVSEEVTTMFAMANIDTESVGCHRLSVRSRPRQISHQPASHATVAIWSNRLLAMTTPTCYLASTCASRSMTRRSEPVGDHVASRMDEMNASFSIGVGQTPDDYGNYASAGGGNPA